MARKIRMKARERSREVTYKGRAFRLPDLLEERRLHGEAFFEFLRIPAMSAGVYALPAGARTRQHHLRAVYYAMKRAHGSSLQGAAGTDVRIENLPYRRFRENHSHGRGVSRACRRIRDHLHQCARRASNGS